MSKKIERKNKTNPVVTWPNTPYFIIEDLIDLNKGAKEITLRFRLSKEIENGNAVEIGSKSGGQGRPKKVFAFTPVPQSTLDLAYSHNINPVDKVGVQKLFSIPQVTASVLMEKSREQAVPVL